MFGWVARINQRQDFPYGAVREHELANSHLWFAGCERLHALGRICGVRNGRGVRPVHPPRPLDWESSE